MVEAGCDSRHARRTIGSGSAFGDLSDLFVRRNNLDDVVSPARKSCQYCIEYQFNKHQGPYQLTGGRRRGGGGKRSISPRAIREVVARRTHAEVTQGVKIKATIGRKPFVRTSCSACPLKYSGFGLKLYNRCQHKDTEPPANYKGINNYSASPLSSKLVYRIRPIW